MMQGNVETLLDEEQPESQAKLWLKRGLIATLVIVVLGGLGYGIKTLMSGGAPQKKQMTTIKLLPDTPPPPPPPPPKEPPKEQPKEQPKEAPKAPEPKPAETPPAENLKMEGPAGDGPSPFEAGSVSNDYKGGDVKTIGSDGGLKFNWYAGLIKSEIEQTLQRNKQLTEGQYKLVVTVWVKPNGDIEKLSVVQSDASPEIEQAIKAVLDAMPSIREAPPEGMPQPVKLRITARKMG